jgi:hypothetical protein
LLRIISGIAALGVVLALAFALYQAFAVRLHTYDGFDYLNDARRLSGDEAAVAAYYRVHAPLVPTLAVPVVRAVAHAPPDDPARWTLPHLLGVALAALSVLACFLWIRERTNARWAWLGALFVASTPLFVHYAHHILVDVSCAGWVAATFFAWDRATRGRGGWRHYGLFGVAIAGATLTKYALGALPIAFVLAELLRVVIERKLRARRWLGLVLAGAVAATLFAAAMSAAFFVIDGDVLTARDFAALLGEASGMVAPMEGEGAWDYLPLLFGTVSVFTLGLSLVGLVDGLRRDWRRDLPAATWIALFGGLLAFRVGHNEARYLLPVLPAVALFATLGARSLVRMARRGLPLPARRTAIATLGVALALSVAPGVSRAARDTHPFFRSDTQAVFARWVEDHAPGGGKVLWAGHFVALTPPDPSPGLVEDEFFDYFHLGHPAVHFLTDAHMEGVDGFPDPAEVLRRDEGAADVFVVGPREFVFAYAVAHGAERPATFELFARRRLTLRPEGDRWVDDGGTAWLRTIEDADGRVTVEALRDLGEVDLAARAVLGPRMPLGRHHLGEGDRATVRGGWSHRGAQLHLVSIVSERFPASWAP